MNLTTRLYGTTSHEATTGDATSSESTAESIGRNDVELHPPSPCDPLPVPSSIPRSRIRTTLEQISESIPFHKIAAYTKSQLDRARLARRLCATLWHPGEDAIKVCLAVGWIRECPVIWIDYQRATDIWGPCRGCLQGKMTNTAQIWNLSDRPETIGQVISIDFMFLPGPNGSLMVILLCVDQSPHGLWSAFWSFKRDVATVQREHLEQLILRYARCQVTIKVLMSDSDTVLKACGDWLAERHIKLITHAPNVHDPYVEKAIDPISNKFRATILSLPYRLPPSKYGYAVTDLVDAHGICPNSVNVRPFSPRALLEGENVAFNALIRSTFGQPVFALVPQTKRGKDVAASEFGIIIKRSFSQSGKASIWFPYRQEGMNILPCDRNVFHSVALTQRDIDTINALHAAESKKSPKVNSFAKLRLSKDEASFRTAPFQVDDPFHEHVLLGHEYEAGGPKEFPLPAMTAFEVDQMRHSATARSAAPARVHREADDGVCSATALSSSDLDHGEHEPKDRSIALTSVPREASQGSLGTTRPTHKSTSLCREAVDHRDPLGVTRRVGTSAPTSEAGQPKLEQHDRHDEVTKSRSTGESASPEQVAQTSSASGQINSSQTHMSAPPGKQPPTFFGKPGTPYR